MSPDFPTCTPIDLILALTRPDAPILMDVRLPEDVEEIAGRLPTAIPVPHTDAHAQVVLAQGKGAIVICHKGLKLSAGVTARLSNHGIAARRLRGGQVEWVGAGLPVSTRTPPTIYALPLDATAAEVASCWAAIRFTAPGAELLQVPRADLDGVAARFDACIATARDAPAMPGLADFLEEVGTNPLFAAQLVGAGDRPSAAFPCLDAAYRGRLRTMPDAPTPTALHGAQS
ncbi:rhodanese-like domain-containing protein [Hasllibacter sp. MH4015]|uniref:rhodanese-like domain-containing protein n=1 Tax=Hasllibacter sp. MH4015 TaxID=2854029 RepID=UPI001CD4DCDC|nr:rhodanese-like domain-containing protein [Hasllibacter sp. MH4015]